MNTQQIKAKARREITKELENALSNRLEWGTIVTRHGRAVVFTVRYPEGLRPFVTVNHPSYGVITDTRVNDAVSTILSAMGLTR